MPEIVKAFIARSFAESDEQRLGPLLELLRTFEKLGFVCESAKPAEANAISEKVQRLIRDSKVFIGMFTRKYPVANAGGAGGGETQLWTAPSWVLQESGFALAVGCKLLFFVEHGVELPELAGDLEVIYYDHTKPDLAFKRANEMIFKIISENLALNVEPVIRQGAQPPPAEQSVEQDQKPDVPDLVVYLDQIFEGLNKGDIGVAWKGYTGGLEHVKRDEPQFETLWKAFYHRERALHGYPEGQSELEALEAEHPESHEPPAALALCRRQFDDPSGAADAFKRAARKAPAETKVSYLLNAAECEEQAKSLPAARNTLVEALELASPQQRFDVLSKLYENAKLSDRKYDAFAIGERSLHENGAQVDLRFKLAYDYADSDFGDLAAYHYGTLLDQRGSLAVAMNNLALVFGSLGLPIMSVELFKKAFEAGNTLAAGNLAFRYINNGMIDEAQTIVDQALKASESDAMVTDALAAIRRGRGEESKKHAAVLSEAQEKRDFFMAMGEAILSKQAATVEGKWDFLSVEIDLRNEADILKGAGVKPIYPDGLEAVLFDHDRNVPFKSEIFEVEGSLAGRVGHFKMSSVVQYVSGGPSPYDRGTQKEGYLVFARDGKTAKVLETEPKIELHEITRVEPDP